MDGVVYGERQTDPHSVRTTRPGRHLILLHPFYARSVEEALVTERQALGRINRIGQVASSVVVWRLVTRGTIEEEMHESQHQASLESRSTAGKRKRQ